MSGDLFLSRPEMSHLMAELRRLRRVLPDLAVTIARQGVASKAGSTGRHVARSLPPIDLTALDADSGLHSALYGTVRAVCAQHRMGYAPIGYVSPRFVGPLYPGQRYTEPGHIPTTLDLANWLDRNLYPFAMTTRAPALYIQILDAIRDCDLAVDLPAEDPVIVSEARVRAANNSILTTYQIEAIAARLGEAGQGLNRDRIRTLVKNGLREADRDGDTKFYRLGDVLAAHAQLKRRNRRGSAAVTPGQPA